MFRNFYQEKPTKKLIFSIDNEVKIEQNIKKNRYLR